ncbi:MAG: hypothetical protein VW875_12045 [Planctomycetaceae bacterium]
MSIASTKRMNILASSLAAILFVTSSSTAQVPITDIAISPKGESYVFVSQKGLSVVKAKASSSNQSVFTIVKHAKNKELPTSNLHALSFSPDGKRLLVCGGRPSESAFLGVYSWPRLVPLETLTIAGDSLLTAIWVSDSQIATGGLDTNVRILDANSLTVTHVLGGHSNGITSMALIKPSRLLISAGLDNSLRIWSLEDYSLVRSLNQHIHPVLDVASQIPKEGLPIVASASEDRTIRFWQPTIGRMVRFIKLPAKPQSINWVGENILAAACDNGQLYIIDTLNVETVGSRQLKTGWCYDTERGPAKYQLVITGANGVIESVSVPTILSESP